MKLKFFKNSNGKKEYTLKEKIPNSGEETKPAHYKFVKIRDAPKGPMPNHKKRFSNELPNRSKLRGIN